MNEERSESKEMAAENNLPMKELNMTNTKS
jgi:hypothetical protein